MEEIVFILEDDPPFDKIYVTKKGDFFAIRKNFPFDLNLNLYFEAKKFNNLQKLAVHLANYIRDLAEIIIPYAFFRDKGKKEFLERMRYEERENDFRYRHLPDARPGVKAVYILDCDDYEGILTDKLLHILRNKNGIILTQKDLDNVKKESLKN